VDPMLSTGQIKKLYDLPDYFELDYDCGITSGSYFDNRESILERHRYALDIFKNSKLMGNFLEIGCAGGFFLDVMRAAGWKVWGIDLSKSAIQFARQRKLNVMNKDLYGAKFKSNSFDAILMGDVFEHVPDPVDFLNETFRILKPGGVLVVKTPAYLNTWLYRFFYGIAKFLKLFSKSRLKSFSVLKIPWHRETLNRPYHLYEYNPSCMRTLLERCSFKVESVDGGVIQLYFFQQLTSIPLPAFFLTFCFYFLKVVSWCFNLPLGTMIAVAHKPDGR
jgi:SAM-dependent methyltransferase